MLSQILDFFVTFLILMILHKCLHIWDPVDRLSLSASVIPFIAVVQEMSHFAPSVMSVMSHNTTGNG